MVPECEQFRAGEKALLTLSGWFYAPDGVEYRAVFGTVKGVHSAQETLGVQTNRNSANWYVEIGNMIIAGCQVHYAVRTDICNLTSARGWHISDQQGFQEYSRPSAIYFADEFIFITNPSNP